jgi:hypothetical protein
MRGKIPLIPKSLSGTPDFVSSPAKSHLELKQTDFPPFLLQIRSNPGGNSNESTVLKRRKAAPLAGFSIANCPYQCHFQIFSPVL